MAVERWKYCEMTWAMQHLYQRHRSLCDIHRMTYITMCRWRASCKTQRITSVTRTHPPCSWSGVWPSVRLPSDLSAHISSGYLRWSATLLIQCLVRSSAFFGVPIRLRAMYLIKISTTMPSTSSSISRRILHAGRTRRDVPFLFVHTVSSHQSPLLFLCTSSQAFHFHLSCRCLRSQSQSCWWWSAGMPLQLDNNCHHESIAYVLNLRSNLYFENSGRFMGSTEANLQCTGLIRKQIHRKSVFFKRFNRSVILRQRFLILGRIIWISLFFLGGQLTRVCAAAYVLDPGTKSKLLQLDANNQMRSQIRGALFRSIFGGSECPWVGSCLLRRLMLISSHVTQDSIGWKWLHCMFHEM